jgi:hypothetical protein
MWSDMVFSQYEWLDRRATKPKRLSDRVYFGSILTVVELGVVVLEASHPIKQQQATSKQNIRMSDSLLVEG